MSLRSILNDIFVKPTKSELLPTITKQLSSPHGPKPRPDEIHKIRTLMTHGAARTEADGVRLLRKYRGLSVMQIVKKAKPERRRLERWKKILNRAKRWL